MAPETDATATPRDDAELMRRVQTGDEAAFTALMQAWEVPVKSVIARLVLNASEAEDLAQETFVRLWQHRDRFDSGKPVKPWILGIAVNLARNRLRWCFSNTKRCLMRILRPRWAPHRKRLRIESLAPVKNCAVR